MESNNTVTEEKTLNQAQTTQVAETVETQETPEQINWKKFREERQKERVERERLAKSAEEEKAKAQAIQEAMEALLNKKGSNQTNDEFEEESEEQRIDKRLRALLEEKERKEREERQRREQTELPQNLKKAYSDFEQVCTSENLDYFEYHYPELARSFQYQPNTFDKWSDIYKAIKRFMPNADSKKEEAKIQKNLNKPQSISSPGATRVGDQGPVYLDDKRRSDNWKRMQKIMKGG